ncbi:phage tail protein [Lactiplantibacillus argentoratensis]|uniref:phage tail protein n=1 Tax=Lactiplantibacillus argentoratensis TaxID=271881 RepID=UPI002551205C|nr:phage tail protein [Lactiplantibacillus argentoratensis]MDK9681653.1 phage tail protein [Lactiplantibacillus argentoratensis]
MAESNATQVILTDDGIKIIKAQNTADNAASGVTDLNDPNLMSVIEKQTEASQYAGLTSQYNVVLARAKEASISTTALTTAYTNLNTFMTAILMDTTKASDVNRDTYKSLTDAYNMALSNVQTALSNNFNTDISNMRSSVSTASQAASSAAIVASQAATAGDNASQAASQAASAANKASVDYKTLSTGVADGSFVHITTKTVIDDAVIGTAEIVDAAITDAKIGNIKADKITAGTIDFNTITGKNINASNITTGTLSTDRLNVDKLSAVSANLGDVTTGSLKGVDIVANTFSTPNGSFTTDKNGSVVASSLTIRGVTNLVYNAALLGANGAYIPGWGINNGGGCWISNTHDGVPSIGFHSNTGSGVWNVFAQTKLHPLNGDVYQPFSASVWFKEYGSDTSLQYQFTLAFFDSNSNRINGGFAGNTWNGIGSEQDWRYVTVENVTPPSNAIYVGLQYWSYNGNGNACFSSPMLTQTAQATGYQPDTGNVVSAGEIDGSVINGSTINGGTLNMQTDGLINSPYTGVQQTADQFYHPWKLNTGQLTIGQGYITSVSSGTRSINGVAKQFNSLQGTLSASYLKFTNDYGARTYIDADMFTYSNQTNDTAMVAISAGGIGINMGTVNAPALTISNGYIDASSSSSYGIFGAITLGYNAHTINSDSSLFFESGHGSGNPGINIWAKGFQSLSSRLSTKRQIRLLDDEHSNSLLLGADTASFQYNQDTNADNSNEGVIIDDVNTAKQYSLPDELITRDGKAPTDLMSFIARVISQNKYQARLIEDLQIRLRKVEIKNE